MGESLLNPRAFFASLFTERLHHYVGARKRIPNAQTGRKFVLCNVNVALAKHGELFFMWSETVVHTTPSWELPWGMPSTLLLCLSFLFLISKWVLDLDRLDNSKTAEIFKNRLLILTNMFRRYISHRQCDGHESLQLIKRACYNVQYKLHCVGKQ